MVGKQERKEEHKQRFIDVMEDRWEEKISADKKQSWKKRAQVIKSQNKVVCVDGERTVINNYLNQDRKKSLAV